MAKTSNGVPNKKICVIGAGPSGLAVIKSCREEGLNVVCYERSDALGGLWYYREEVVDGVSSVAKATVINTSKEYSGFSDYPPPENYPNFMHNSLMLKYFQSYADHFGLDQYIKYNHKVVEVTYGDDYDKTGRWKVTTEKSDDGVKNIEIFDGVVICTGHHVTPLIPAFKGQEKFRGKISHTHSYKTSKGYENKTIVVIGVGNSGGDAAVELSYVAKAVYLATRRGVWVRGRVGNNGMPTEHQLATRAFNWFSLLFPQSIVNTLVERWIDFKMNHELYGLKPKHRFMEQHPFINDSITNCIMSGRIIIKPNIREFTEDGVIFEGCDGVIKCDEVILATGYQMKLPFIDPSIIAPSTNEVYLFKNMFKPELKYPHTLALIGLTQPLGPIHTTAEMQARWYASLMADRIKLPSRDKMNEVIKVDKEFYKRAFYDSPRHSLEILYIPYMEELADYIGCKPNLLKYALTDPVLFYHLIFGLFSAYQFRLEGRHKWSGARDAILQLNDRVAKGLQQKEVDFHQQQNKNNNS